MKLESSLSRAAVAVLCLSPLAAALPDVGDTERVSVDSSGVEGNERSDNPSISDDGRFVAFDSWADDLVSGDTNISKDVFVHDRLTGATTRVSVSSGGGQGDHNSYDPSISADGSLVVFTSKAKTLVSGDTNGSLDTFLHDRNTGLTTRVSVGPGGAQSFGHSYDPEITPDGRYVVFASAASDLVASDTNNQQDIFRRDLTAGTNVLVSLSSTGMQANGNSFRPEVSEDGQTVAFGSNATNLVAGDTNGQMDVFVRELATGQTTRVSVDSSGVQGNSFSWFSTISDDGRYVAFESLAGTLVPSDGNFVKDVFLHDRATGVTSMISVGPSGTEGNNVSLAPSISEDGRYVAFESWANNLIAADLNTHLDIFVHDTLTQTTQRVSHDPSGLDGDNHSQHVNISADGRFVAFKSDATNLVPGDTNAWGDAFVHDYLGIPPTLTLKANGADSFVVVTYPAPLTLTASLDPGDHAGQVADWWVVGSTVIGDFWFKPFLWQLSAAPLLAYQGPLFAFQDIPLFSAPMPPVIPGFDFTFYLDDNADGILDQTWSDGVSVTLQ